MSWSIYATGTREKVSQKVRETKFESANVEEKSEFDTIQSLILNRIEALRFPGGTEYWVPNGVRVEASGHGHEGGGNFSVRVETVRLEI